MLTHVSRACRWDGRFTDGKPGKAAPSVSEQPPVGRAGANGSSELTESEAHDFDLPVRGLRLLAIEAERRHILGDKEGAASLAGWLFSISARSGNRALADVRHRSASILAHLETGSPPAGVTGLHAPVVSLARHLAVMKSMLESNFRAANYLRELRVDADSAEKIGVTLSWARGEASRIAAEAETRLPELAEAREEIVERLNEQTDTWPALWRQVMDVDQEFKNAVADQAGPDCEFLDVVIVASTIVTSIASGGAGALGVVGGVAKLGSYLADDESVKEEYNKTVDWTSERKTSIDGIAKGANALRTSAQRLKDLLGGDALSPPSDHVRLSMTRDDFNEMIEPYLELEEAKELQDLMEKFFTLVETRNSLLVEHDQLVVDAAELRSRVMAARARVNEILAHEAGTLLLDATSVHETAMWTELELRKRFLAVVVEANAAYEHQALRSRRLELRGSRPEELEAEFRRLEQDSLELEGRTPEISSIRRLVVTRSTHPEVFEELAASGTANVTLVPPQTLAMWDERADSVAIAVSMEEGADDIDAFGHLVSSGLSIIVNARGDRLATRIPRRPANPKIASDIDLEELARSRNLSGVGAAVGVSPYGVWRLRAPELGRAIENVTELLFLFYGTARLTSTLRTMAEQTRALQRAQTEDIPGIEAMKFGALAVNRSSENLAASVKEAIFLSWIEKDMNTEPSQTSAALEEVSPLGVSHLPRT